MSFLSDAFGRALKLRRKELRLSQAALANRMETEAPTISRWENGEFLPADTTTDKLLNALETDPSLFLRAMSGSPDKDELIDEKVMSAIERGAAQIFAEKRVAEPTLGYNASPYADILEKLTTASDKDLNLVRGILGLERVETAAEKSFRLRKPGGKA